MRRLLSYVVASAIVIGGVVVVSVRDPSGITTEDQATNRKTLISMIVARASQYPAAGQCRDVEVGIQHDDVPDASDKHAQSVCKVCSLTGAEQAVAQALPAKKCRQSARALCLDAADTSDAGDETRSKEERRCLRDAQAECESAIAKAGQVIWAGPPYAAVLGVDVEVDCYSRREQARTMCACASSRDAGLCRRDDHDGGSVRMVPGALAQPGEWSGRGCVASPCAEGTAYRTGPGSLYPAECRP